MVFGAPPQGSGGGAFVGGTLTAQVKWNTGLGGITHLLGPTDQLFEIKGGPGSGASAGQTTEVWGGNGGATGDGAFLSAYGGSADAGSGVSGGTIDLEGGHHSGVAGYAKVYAGGSAGTDATGPPASLEAGPGTGAGAPGSAFLKTAYPRATGTTAQVMGHRLFCSGPPKALTNNTATTFALLSTASNSSVGGTVFYTVRVTDAAGNEQTSSGCFSFVGTNKAGALTVAASAASVTAQNLVTGTDTIAAGVTTSGTSIALQMTSNSSLTIVTHDITYTIVVNGSTTITPQ